MKLPVEYFALHVTGGEVTEIVQAGFAHRNHAIFTAQFAQQRLRAIVKIRGQVRMHASRREQFSEMAAGEFQRTAAARLARPGYDHLHDARVTGAL